MRLGIETLLAAPPAGERLGLLTHPAAVLPDLTLGLDALVAAGHPVVAVFGAEHGLRGTAQAGFAEDATVDGGTGLPVFDTYQRSLDVLLAVADIDVLLIDLQHVGARFYTYESSLYDAIGAAERAGVRVRVLDRPNPAGGEAIDGPVLRSEYASFVGRAPIPMRHGMTMGELAGLFAVMRDVPTPEVVPMEGWHRSQTFQETGLVWVPPSPNLPTTTAAQAYLGTCLFEGTNVSVGRGTTTPFEIIGAPFLDGRLAAHLRSLDLPGAAIRDCALMPAFDEYRGEQLHGVAVHVTDVGTFDPIRLALLTLTAIERLYPGMLEYRGSFDRLAGTDALRSAIVAGETAAEIAASWSADLLAFAAWRDKFLIYE
ncbi:MAG TPA: DUF1343 domain-containing protein [Micromonosporaceae bacterium]